MFHRKLSFETVLLILINLVPLYGVWFESWDPLGVFIVYCLETVIVGVITVVKLALTSYYSTRVKTSGGKNMNRFLVAFLMIGFFIVHYGIFVFVQTQMFFGIAGIGTGENFFMKYVSAGQLLGTDPYVMLFFFIAWYCLDMVTGFLLPGKFRTIPSIAIMFQPYGRIFIQQVIVIIGSFFLALHMPRGFMLVFVIVKIVADIMLSRYLNTKPFGTDRLAAE